MNKWNYDIDNMSRKEIKDEINRLGDELAEEYSKGSYGIGNIDKIEEYTSKIEYLKNKLNTIVLEKYRKTDKSELKNRIKQIEEKLNPDYYDTDINDALGADVVDELNIELDELKKELQERKNREFITIEYNSNSPKSVRYKYEDKSKNKKVEKLKNEMYSGNIFKKLEKRFENEGMIDEYNKIFKNKNLSKIKYCDPEIVFILCKERGYEAVIKYLGFMEKGVAKDEEVPFKITYNIDDIWKDTEMSLAEKIHMNNIAKASKGFAEVKQEKKGIFSIVGDLLGFETKNKQKLLEEKSEESKVVNEEIKKEEPKSKMEDLKVEISKVNKEKTKKKVHKDVELGSVLNLPEGLELNESISGGVSGKIGDINNSKDGIYVIDYSAEIDESDVKFTYGLDGIAKPTLKDSNQFIHISFVEGAKTLDEAKQLIEKYKDEAKDGQVDYKKIKPAGWISMEKFEEINELNKEENER